MKRKIVSPPTYRRAKSLGNILVRARVPSGFPIWRKYGEIRLGGYPLSENSTKSPSHVPPYFPGKFSTGLKKKLF